MTPFVDGVWIGTFPVGVSPSAAINAGSITVMLAPESTKNFPMTGFGTATPAAVIALNFGVLTPTNTLATAPIGPIAMLMLGM